MALVLPFLFALTSSWLWYSLLVLIVYWFYMRISVGNYETNLGRTDGKTFIITGSESGIGFHTADLLSARGGRIILACKDVALGNAVKDKIVQRTLNTRIEVKHLDLSSLESVRKFADEIHQTVDKLDVLVNNSSTCSCTSSKTDDGLNSIMQENYFGHFLLTNLLLDLLKTSSPSRIVFVSSILHHFHKLNLEDLNNEKDPVPSCRLYFNSKLATIIIAKYFARTLQGTGVTVNTLNPGMVQSDATTSSNNCSGLIGKLCSLWISAFGKTTREGAMTSCYLATDPALTYVTGEHFDNCKISKCVASITKDHITQETLYRKSSELVKLSLEEIH